MSFAKLLAVDVVPHDRVVEVGVPVELDRAGDVAGVVQQHVLVGLEHHDAVVAAGPEAALCSASQSVVTSRSGWAYWAKVEVVSRTVVWGAVVSGVVDSAMSPG